MDSFENVVITKIDIPVVVSSTKGHYFEMENRATFGLSLCISGQIIYTSNGKQIVSNKSTAIILPKGASYTLRGDKEGFFPVVNFWCSGLDITEVCAIELEHPDACLKLFNTVKELASHEHSRLKMFSTFYELLNEVFRSDKQNNTHLDSAVRLIAKNMHNPEFSNTTLAQQLGISEVYLRKLFASHYNTSPKQYILDCRIKKAKQILVDTSFSITAIAAECGFQSLYHFCRTFKNRTGLTPTQFADNNKVFKI